MAEIHQYVFVIEGCGALRASKDDVLIVRVSGGKADLERVAQEFQQVIAFNIPVEKRPTILVVDESIRLEQVPAEIMRKLGWQRIPRS